jgi:hypothetical protein
MDYVYSGLHFYRAAEAYATTEKQPQAARTLLQQTGNFLMSCSQKSDVATFKLSRSLLVYFAAVCFGRSFAVGSSESQRLHKTAVASLRANKPVAPDLMGKVFDASAEAFKSLDYYRHAVAMAQTRLDFPHDLMLQSFRVSD